MRYTIGDNMPGYLPENDDEPEVFETFESALHVLKSLVGEWAENDDEQSLAVGYSPNTSAHARAFLRDEIDCAPHYVQWTWYRDGLAFQLTDGDGHPREFWIHPRSEHP